MRRVLVDSSVWIDYFRNSDSISNIDRLLDENRICVNKVILAELVPFLKERNENELIDILRSIDEAPLSIDWEEVTDFQIRNLNNHIRRVGIPDLIILQNVMQNDLELYTLDKHFVLMNQVHKFMLFNP